MPKYIIHHKGVYNMFSTISDHPMYDKGFNLEDFMEEYQYEYGRDGLMFLAPRLDRARKRGTSERPDRFSPNPSLEDLVSIMIVNNTPEQFDKFRDPKYDLDPDEHQDHDMEGFMKLFIETYLTLS